MAGLSTFSHAVRSTAWATRSLASSMRLLSLLPSRPKVAPTQTRCLSQAALSPRSTFSASNPIAGATVPRIQRGLVFFQKQQTRGMKVRSAIKKRCEHCKVVRRKASKRRNGYLYIICPANPRHKQRQG